MFQFREQFLKPAPINDFVDEFEANVQDRIETISNLDLGQNPGDLLGELSPTGLLGSDINNFISDTLFG